ncbi:MAG: hypothetical protein ACOYNL_08250 [Rickettsiales bacterium]
MSDNEPYNHYHDARQQRQHGYRVAHDDGEHQSDGLDKHEADQFAKDAFRESAAALSNTKIGETKKFLGLFSMDAGIVDMFNGAYNFGADYVSTRLRPQTFRIVEKFAPRVGLNGNAAKSAAALATIGSTVAVKAAGYFGTMYEDISGQIKTQQALAHKIAPVLDDIKGNHSLASLYTVSQQDNEVIFAHRKRLARIANATNLTNAVNLGLNAGGSLVFDVKGLHTIWNNRATLHHQDVNRLAASATAIKTADELLREQMDAKEGTSVLKAGGLSLLPQFVSRLSATNQHKLRTELSPYSALQMILELGEQVASSPDARGFSAPKSFQSPHGHPEQYSLEEYVMRIFIQHQKDMAVISTEHTEIRDALRQDLAVATKPIVAAIRNGDISTMSLVRMVGEGHIIKKKGRAIASADEVKALIAKEAPKQATYVNVDPAEYYKDAAFTRAQLKTALKALDGEERAAFAAMFPDAVLKEAGMSAKDIKGMRDATAKHYDTVIAQVISGLNAKSDEALKTDGLAENEVQHVRESAQKIQESGVEAVKQLKTSAANENGIEHLLTNAVVHRPEYFGKLNKSGKESLAGASAADGALSHVGRLRGAESQEDLASAR